MNTFDQFTSDEFDKLKRHNVKNVQLLTTKRSTHRIIMKMIPISDLVARYTKTNDVSKTRVQQVSDQKFNIPDDIYQIVTKSTNTAIIIVLVIIAIIIIGIGIGQYLNTKNSHRS